MGEIKCWTHEVREADCDQCQSETAAPPLPPFVPEPRGDWKKRVIDLIDRNGDIIIGDDGYRVFWPTTNRGAYTPDVLRIIADELDARNKAWDGQVQAMCERSEKET